MKLQIFIGIDTFNLKREWIDKILKLIIAEGLNKDIKYMAPFRANDNLIDEELEIMVFDPKTGEMRYEKPLAFHVYDYDGFMIDFIGNKVDMSVTPNHTMLGYKRDKETAYSMEAKDFSAIGESDRYIKCHADYVCCEDVQNVKIGSYDIGIDEFLKIVGYYLSEGYCEYKENKGRYIVSISQSKAVNPNIYEDIDCVMSDSGFEYKKYEYEGKASTWNILRKDVSKYFKNNFGSKSNDKRIPQWIKNLPADKIRIMIDSYLDGDASIYSYSNGDYIQAATTSKQLSYDSFEVLFKCGLSPVISNYTKTTKECKQYVVNCHMNGFGKGRMPRIKDSHINVRRYKGKVWCFETSTGFFVTERNGRIAIQGNTGKIHNITAELDYIGKEILDGLMLNQALLNGEMAAYNCLDALTYTLTDSGYKKWDEIDENDKIACYNPDTKCIEYHHYIEKHVYDYDGEMIQFKTDKIDVKATPNHRMWSAKRDSDEFRFIEAQDVRRRARFVGAVEGFEGEYMPSVEIGDQSYSIYDYCELAGFFVSEGSTSLRKGRVTNVNVHQSKDGKAYSDIESVYDNCFDKYWYAGGYWSTWNPKLAEHFRSEYGHHSTTKRLPSWVKNLSTECLEIVINAMLQGDGCTKHDETREVNGSAYYTSSKQLAEDFTEIAFKCGYVVKLTTRKSNTGTKRYFNKTGHEFRSKHQQYVVYISEGFKGRKPVLDSRSKECKGKEVTRVPYKGKVYCFTVPHGLFVSMRNGLMTIQGNSAQIGAETMIMRLETWRSELKEWVEKSIFLPIAKMQGFIDEEESKDSNEIVYLYPTLKWEDMNLRDNTNKLQMFIQLNQNGKISDRTLLESFDMNYDQEVERLREQQVMAMQSGMIQPGMEGTGGGGMGAAGGGVAGAPPGGDMGLGGDMGGGMGGDMGGGMGAAPGMGGGMGGGMSAAAGAEGTPGKVYKKGKAPKSGEMSTEEMAAMQPVTINLTAPEAKLWRLIKGMRLPFEIYAQYKQSMPGNDQPFIMDFAIPHLRLDIEADGEKWHTSVEDRKSDNERDMKLAHMGWSVIRFGESAINENIDQVKNVLEGNISEMMAQKQKMKKAGAETTRSEYIETLTKEESVILGYNSILKQVSDNGVKTG